MEKVFIALGAGSWALALVLALFPTVEVDQFVPVLGKVKQTAPNVATGLAAAGFAVAGGLCFIAAALRGRDEARPDRRPSARMPEHLSEALDQMGRPPDERG